MTRRIQGQLISRPILLSKDYAASLKAVMINDALYYSYIDINGSLCVKNPSLPEPVYKSDSNKNRECTSPCLAVINKSLVLLFCECINDISKSGNAISGSDDLDNNTYRIRYVVSPEKSNNAFTSELDLDLSSAAQISIVKTGSNILLCVCCNNKFHLFSFTDDFSIISYHHDTHSALTAKESQIKQIEKELTDKDTLIKTMKTELADRDSQIETIKKELSIRNAQIESAKIQYNELMEVATRYRDEATKWRMRLASK